ncbi:MAG TPA: MarR family winged helix-turn-helix transcriptional regulator, partial [Actinomycetospora sp.]|uniref:MarR family winged helix-turn-helix transcriptional regulator n=1 Tax=Actinomycetospora sp. TaxID=1872135 RepID=UPI002F4054ED
NEADVLGELLHQGDVTPTQIAARTGLTAGSATTLIDRLVSAGLVARAAHPEDGRRILVGLTPRGRSAIDTMFSLFAADLENALSQADPALATDSQRRDSLTELLRAMASSLRARAADPARIQSSVRAAGRAGDRAACDSSSTSGERAD